MALDQNACYRALRARDPRFDGRFFTAVRTTGVFCRPVCPAPTPKRQNCLFVPSAAAAREAGFRPCLRCRPEASPGTPAWLGTSATVSRALRLIDAGALDEEGVDALAARLGVGARHLRRLFVEHLGAPPLAVAQTRRVLFAAKLLRETSMPITDVAFAAGFGSLRRMQDAIRTAYGRAPRALRKSNAPAETGEPRVTLRLPYRAPLHWPALQGFFARRAVPGVEAATRDTYRRTFAVGTACGTMDVRNDEARSELVVELALSTPIPLVGIAAQLRQMFDLGASPDLIAAQLGEDPVVGRAVGAAPGLRVPGGWDPFELAVRAILGQQISVGGATTLAARLAERFGEELPRALTRPGLCRLFPTAEALASADIAPIGVPRKRADAIAQLARGVASGALRFDEARELDETISSLVALPGIGAWTAQYIAMRALREPDAFPAGDLGLAKALSGNGPRLSTAAVRARAEAWRPWRAYAAMYLWHAGAAKAKVTTPHEVRA